jgi:DtxR family Mn-dependent transcriptional regulator
VPSLTVENYVKTILIISSASGGRPASTGEIATALSVSPGTVTSMLKTLGESHLATYTRYEGVQLTPAGEALALRVLRRHRLIELFLATTLKLNWDEVHEEAEHMEHAVSDRLVDRIDEWLGFPSVDPHGDPIPRSDGSLREMEHRGHVLAQCEVGQSFRVTRVLDQSPEFLRYLSDAQLELGAQGVIASIRPEARVITVRVGEAEIPLSCEAAEKIAIAQP